MKKISFVALGLAVSTLVVSTLVAATPQGGQSPAQQSAAQPAQDPDTGVFTRLCSDCHDAERVVTMRRTSADWEDVIKKMIEKGAGGTDKELETVYNYLVRSYGRVYINTAKSPEIATILGLSSRDADAIVAYRTANGKFADFDAVKKVPGIDVKKLDERKDAVAF